MDCMSAGTKERGRCPCQVAVVERWSRRFDCIVVLEAILLAILNL